MLNPANILKLFVGTAIASVSSYSTAETLFGRGDYLMNGVVACGNCHTPKERCRVGSLLAS